jgi:excinuclease ABC subunit A
MKTPIAHASTTPSEHTINENWIACISRKRSTGRTLYVLDEPTTGLHFEDIRNLLEVLQLLVERGNTVVVIEHNLDVIKTADYVIDLGPEGGNDGGRLVAEGTPEEVMEVASSHTGVALREVLGTRPAAKKVRRRKPPEPSKDSEAPVVAGRGAARS